MRTENSNRVHNYMKKLQNSGRSDDILSPPVARTSYRVFRNLYLLFRNVHLHSDIRAFVEATSG